MSTIRVLKFGGTSLKDASFIKQAADIIAERMADAKPVVIASAVAGVTDHLIKLADDTALEKDDAQKIIHDLKKKHFDLLDELTDTPENSHSRELALLFDELETVFIEQKKRQQVTALWRDQLLSFGERASTHLLEVALTTRKIPARRVNAQYLITTDATFGGANVCADLTREKIQQSLRAIKEIPVITGFIGSTKEGLITTLGRSGSDYTASLIAGALCADLLEIWTDVDGVLTADPKIVPAAQSIDALSYDDIAELSAHGARVIHPKTMDPLRNGAIPVQVRNSLNPKHPGTLIRESFSSNGSFRSVTVTGPYTHLEIPPFHHIAFHRWLFDLFDDTEISNTIFFRASPAEPAQYLIPDYLYQKIRVELLSWLSARELDAHIVKNLFQVKKFSNAILQNDESIARMLQVLSLSDLRPLHWHRGHNRRHVSLLLPEQEAYHAARLIDDLMANATQTVHLFIAGTGAVGGTFIEQVENLDHSAFNFNILGQCNSTIVQWNDEKQPTRWPSIVQQLTDHASSPVIFVDATGSADVARVYPQLFEAGIHIVTPSKLANTFGQSYYDLLRETADEHHAQFRYETTVGAGLPVLSTLNDLLQTGDTITEISGVVSGTMTYLFGQLEKGTPFSKAIVDAREKGYAEPDPRDDLSGEDVARKFLTLAREIGVKIERSELQVESLIPEKLAAVDSDTFLNRLPEFDDFWMRKLRKAQKNGATLRYTGHFSQDGITIGVKEVSQRSPLGQLSGTDNLIRIASARYHQTPIIIQGPGAGRDVTAVGVLADVLKVTEAVL